MKLRNVTQYLVVAASIAACSGALAADKAKKAAPQMDDKAVMEMMQKAAMPGDAHKKLEPLAGKFSVQSKSWMDPTKPPEESSGTTERKWVFGNRYLEEEYQGTFMGQPFNGKGTQGYDNVTKRYFGTWMDSMSTGLTKSSGTLEGNTIKYKGMMSDPMQGKEVPYTMNLTVADNDHHKLEMWGPGPGGKSMKWMEMQYTRVK